jgi:hypothetical protein
MHIHRRYVEVCENDAMRQRRGRYLSHDPEWQPPRYLDLEAYGRCLAQQCEIHANLLLEHHERFCCTQMVLQQYEIDVGLRFEGHERFCQNQIHWHRRLVQNARSYLCALHEILSHCDAAVVKVEADDDGETPEEGTPDRPAPLALLGGPVTDTVPRGGNATTRSVV